VNLCFVGKDPPIEGGVARDGFWTAVALARAGHAVHVVTNADADPATGGQRGWLSGDAPARPGGIAGALDRRAAGRI
jgi:hypothetical protein